MYSLQLGPAQPSQQMHAPVEPLHLPLSLHEVGAAQDVLQPPPYTLRTHGAHPGPVKFVGQLTLPGTARVAPAGSASQAKQRREKPRRKEDAPPPLAPHRQPSSGIGCVRGLRPRARQGAGDIRVAHLGLLAGSSLARFQQFMVGGKMITATFFFFLKKSARTSAYEPRGRGANPCDARGRGRHRKTLSSSRTCRRSMSGSVRRVRPPFLTLSLPVAHL